MMVTMLRRLMALPLRRPHPPPLPPRHLPTPPPNRSRQTLLLPPPRRRAVRVQVPSTVLVSPPRHPRLLRRHRALLSCHRPPRLPHRHLSLPLRLDPCRRVSTPSFPPSRLAPPRRSLRLSPSRLLRRPRPSTRSPPLSLVQTRPISHFLAPLPSLRPWPPPTMVRQLMSSSRWSLTSDSSCSRLMTSPRWSLTSDYSWSPPATPRVGRSLSSTRRLTSTTPRRCRTFVFATTYSRRAPAWRLSMVSSRQTRSRPYRSPTRWYTSAPQLQ